MEAKHINDILEEKVSQIFVKAGEEANSEFALLIGDKLPKLELIDQFRLLLKEYKKICELEQASEHPYYIHNHAILQNLLNQFSSRAFLLNVDESAILHESIKIGRIKSEIEAKIDLTARSIPRYSFEDFLNGMPNPYLFELSISKFLDELELHKIMKWQEESFIEVIDQEAITIIKKIQTKCNSIIDPETFLRNELKNLYISRDEDFKTGEEIKKWLSSLFIVKNQKVDNWDDDVLIYSYNNFKARKCGHRYLMPSSKPKYKGRRNAEVQLSVPEEIAIFGVIVKIMDWLELVLRKGNWEDEYKIIDWRGAMTKSLAEAKRRIELSIKELESAISFLPDIKKEQFIFEQFNHYRRIFNEFQCKRYFEFWTGVAPDAYYRKYTAYGYYEGDPLKQIKFIEEALFIQGMARFVNGKFVDAAQDHMDDYIKMEELLNEIPSILSHMVYSKEFYKCAMFYGNPFYDEYWFYGLPMEMMQFNYRDSLEYYLDSVINKLEKILKNAEQSKGVLYLHSRLKQMRLRNLDYRKYRFTEQRHKIRSKYSDKFKEYLEIEADFIMQTKDISPVHIVPKPTVKTETFESVFPMDKGTLVLNLLEDLGLTVNGKSKISQRRKSAIRGVTQALLETNIAPPLSLEIINKAIATKIGLELPSKLNFTDLSEEYRRKALRAISGK